MKIGFYTSAFGDRPLDEVLDFAAEAGFDAIEIDVNSHIASPAHVAGAVAGARDRGLFVASLTLVGNQLDPDPATRSTLRERTFEFAAAAGPENVPALVIFPGRDPGAAEADDYAAFADHAKGLIAATAASGIAVAIENWPGAKNDYIAVTPDGWRTLFGLIPDPRFGLEFDPSHLIRLGIDPYAALAAVGDRVKILHAKDTSIDAARLQAVGYFGARWWRYRLPGAGFVDWPKFLGEARASGFDGAVCIEHEDFDFGWPRGDVEPRKAGERQALEFLRATLSAS